MTPPVCLKALSYPPHYGPTQQATLALQPCAFSHVPLFATLLVVACHAPLSTRFFQARLLHSMGSQRIRQDWARRHLHACLGIQNASSHLGCILLLSRSILAIALHWSLPPSLYALFLNAIFKNLLVFCVFELLFMCISISLFWCSTFKIIY